MGWRDELAEKIRAINEGREGGSPLASTIVGRRRDGAMFAADHLEISVADGAISVDMAGQLRLANCVNAGEWCGAAAGTLLFIGMDSDPIGPPDFPAYRLTRHYAYRPGLPWNLIPTPGGRMQEFRDGQDNPRYPLVDLG